MSKKLNLEDIEFLINKINSEGFDYTIKDYSEWKEIDDIRFHQLRHQYLKYRQKLLEHIEQLKKRLEYYD